MVHLIGEVLQTKLAKLGFYNAGDVTWNNCFGTQLCQSMVPRRLRYRGLAFWVLPNSPAGAGALFQTMLKVPNEARAQCPPGLLGHLLGDNGAFFRQLGSFSRFFWNLRAQQSKELPQYDNWFIIECSLQQNASKEPIRCSAFRRAFGA